MLGWRGLVETKLTVSHTPFRGLAPCVCLNGVEPTRYILFRLNLVIECTHTRRGSITERYVYEMLRMEANAKTIPWFLVVLFCGALQATGKAGKVVKDVKSVRTMLLQTHNDLRKMHGSPKLKWSKTLAKQSQQWAEVCHYAHAQGTMKDPADNLAAFYNYDMNSTYPTALSNWYNEVDLYNFKDPSKSATKNVFHFTQMVWKDTKQLGCGRAVCKKNSPFLEYPNGEWTYVVCNYFPPGNIVASKGDKFKYFKKNVRPTKV